MPGPPAALFLQQTDIWDFVSHGTAFTYAILGALLLASLYSWTVIFSKLASFRRARNNDGRFLRAFRKAPGLEAILAASEQYRPSPLVAVFEYGYQEVSRQVKGRGCLANPDAISRSLQLAV